MTARTLTLNTALSTSADRAPSGIAAVVSAFVAVVRGVMNRPAPAAVVSEAEIPSNAYAAWRDLSAELVDVQYGYVGNLHGAVRSYMNSAR